jgi:small subunit ribosomal protein S3
MAHKVHPKAFRLKELDDWDSRWFNQKKLPRYLEEDFRIREFLIKKLRDASLQNVEIERFAGKINVIINAARPGLIIGRGGKGVEELKRELERVLGKLGAVAEKRELKLEIREVKSVWASASLVSQWIAQQLEKRIRHRRAIKQALEKVLTDKEVKGVKIEVAGRLGGSEIARREWLKRGRLPCQTLRAIIDYAQSEAFCAYGVIGVKVWIYKGERFE